MSQSRFLDMCWWCRRRRRYCHFSMVIFARSCATSHTYLSLFIHIYTTYFVPQCVNIAVIVIIVIVGSAILPDIVYHSLIHDFGNSERLRYRQKTKDCIVCVNKLLFAETDWRACGGMSECVKCHKHSTKNSTKQNNHHHHHAPMRLRWALNTCWSGVHTINT